MSCTGTAEHEKISLKKRITGELRTEIGLRCKAEGITNFRNKLVVENQETIPMSTLKTIKNEFDHRNVLSKEFFSDAIACKKTFDTLWNETNIKGFIQELNYEPFGLLMICDIQVIYS